MKRVLDQDLTGAQYFRIKSFYDAFSQFLQKVVKFAQSI